MTWRTGRAYSQDLRERVLAAVDGGLRVREAALTSPHGVIQVEF